jgi:hypothetical protein
MGVSIENGQNGSVLMKGYFLCFPYCYRRGGGQNYTIIRTDPFKRVKPLSEISVKQRGWTLDVLNIVRRITEAKRQRAGAVQDASRDSRVIGKRASVLKRKRKRVSPVFVSPKPIRLRCATP